MLVFGHSHIPWDSTASNGLRLLNPGSPTDRRDDDLWLPDGCGLEGVVDLQAVAAS